MKIATMSEVGQELQIIQAFSSVEVPQKVVLESNIKGLITDMLAAQKASEDSANKLDRARKEKKEGNFIGNWWHDRGDKVEDAQLDLNKSIGHLTQKSSQLLIVNTAISKVLNDQQRILLEQQGILKQQTDELAEQNGKIFEQQKLLEEQQAAINAANQGLMEAKGLTQEQAQKLVGCVVRVSEAEEKIEIGNQELRATVEQSMRDSIDHCTIKLNEGFAELDKRHGEFKQQFAADLALHSQQAKTELERFAAEEAASRTALLQQLEQSQQATIATAEQISRTLGETVKDGERKLEAAEQKLLAALERQRESVEQNRQHVSAELNSQAHELKNVEENLALLQATHQKSASSVRNLLIVTACLSAASMAWQIVEHLALR